MEVRMKQAREVIQDSSGYRHIYQLENEGEISNICVYNNGVGRLVCASLVVGDKLVERVESWQIEFLEDVILKKQVTRIPLQQKIVYSNFLSVPITVSLIFSEPTAALLCWTVRLVPAVGGDCSHRVRFNSYGHRFISCAQDMEDLLPGVEFHSVYPRQEQRQFMFSSSQIIEIPSMYYQVTEECQFCQQLDSGFHIQDFAKFREQTISQQKYGFALMWRQPLYVVYDQELRLCSQPEECDLHTNINNQKLF